MQWVLTFGHGALFVVFVELDNVLYAGYGAFVEELGKLGDANVLEFPVCNVNMLATIAPSRDLSHINLRASEMVSGSPDRSSNANGYCSAHPPLRSVSTMASYSSTYTPSVPRSP